MYEKERKYVGQIHLQIGVPETQKNKGNKSNQRKEKMFLIYKDTHIKIDSL